MDGHEVISLTPRLRESPFQEFVEGLHVLQPPVLSRSNFTQITTKFDKTSVPFRFLSSRLQAFRHSTCWRRVVQGLRRGGLMLHLPSTMEAAEIKELIGFVLQKCSISTGDVDADRRRNRFPVPASLQPLQFGNRMVQLPVDHRFIAQKLV